MEAKFKNISPNFFSSEGPIKLQISVRMSATFFSAPNKDRGLIFLYTFLSYMSFFSILILSVGQAIKDKNVKIYTEWIMSWWMGGCKYFSQGDPADVRV